MSDSPPISSSTIRNLSDKLYEKRKIGALDIEQQVKDLKGVDDKKVQSIVDYVVEHFSSSLNANYRKGGLIAIAAIAIGSGQDTNDELMGQLIAPVLKCFVDPDSRVRYYACESMYNIAKVGRNRILPYFNDIFDGLCKLSADPDLNVKNGAQLLDRLIKDVITESVHFDIEKFIPLLKERVFVINPFVRQFLLRWISVLDSVPDIDLVENLPQFLEGMFNMLSDKKKDIRREANNTLKELLKELKEQPRNKVQFGELVSILIPSCTSADELTRQTALTWINELIIYGKEELLPFSAPLVGGILPCLSHEEQQVNTISNEVNQHLLQLIEETKEEFPITEFVNTVTLQFLNHYVPTRLAALRWVLVLHQKSPEELNTMLQELFPALLKTLSDPSDEVVRLDLEVMAKISQIETYFSLLMHSLINLFSTDPVLLENRGSLIIRQLSIFISPEKIYRELASILQTEDDPEFASLMIQTLNIILLTSPEFFGLRSNLKKLQNAELFTTLYRSWCHNPAATFSLCLLAQSYQHASILVHKFAELEVTVNFLVEIDKLVQLLESPIFTSLRLQLLEPEKCPYLYKCLYGLLMLLPQSSAFETLRNRLSSVSNLAILHLIPKSETSPTSDLKLNFDELLNHFEKVQDEHAVYRKNRLAQVAGEIDDEESKDKQDLRHSSLLVLPSTS